MVKYLLLATLAMTATGTAVRAGDFIMGPVSADVVRVIDGDTLLVQASPWPNQRMQVYVRIRGIDTPELRSRCPKDRANAVDARQLLQDLMRESPNILLSNIGGDKYFGRVLADIRLLDGTDAGKLLISVGLATAYQGGKKPPTRCTEQ